MSEELISFHRDEKIRDGFFRLLKVIRGEAAKLHESANVDGDKLHAGRVLIKRTRALLWFARPALPEFLRERSKETLRRSSHLLSEIRDDAMLFKTLEAVSEHVAKPSDRVVLSKTRAQINHPLPSSTTMKRTLATAMRLLERLTEEIVEKIPAEAKWPSVKKRAKKAVHSTFKAQKKAVKKEDDATYHAWRKRAKRLMFELQMTHKQKHVAKQVLKQSHELQDCLGKQQDCAMVESRLHPNGVAALRTTELLRERKTRLRKKSRKIARRLRKAL